MAPIAQLRMTSGNPCSIAEFAIFLEQFGYGQDRGNEYRFVYSGADTAEAQASCAIVLHDLSAPIDSMEIYGQNSEHFVNINHLMYKAGWVACTVTVENQDIEAQMLARFVNVEVVNGAVALPASSLRGAAEHAQPTMANVHALQEQASHEPAPQSGSPPVAEKAIQALEESQHKINSLTLHCNNLEQQTSELQDAIAALSARNRELESQLAAGSKSGQIVHSAALLNIIETYLLPKLDLLSSSSVPEVQALRELGYHIELRLVKAA